MGKPFERFSDFYPFYLGEHQHPVCRRLHFIGTSCALVLSLAAIWRLQPLLLAWALFVGYAFAWVGHFFFEKNRPATFTHPFYSFLGDWVMWKDIITGRIKF